MAIDLKKTDVVIVGLGAVGGVAALPLARAGLEVIGLEAGTWLSPRDFAPDELRNNFRGWPQSAQKANGEIPTHRPNASAPNFPRLPIHPMMNAVGGTSLHYWAQSWRLNPWDFRVVSETRRRYGAARIPKGSGLEPRPWTVMVNPVITPKTDAKTPVWERCLSVPGLHGKVPRFLHIEITYLDLEGRRHTHEARSSWAALLQHECDHLDGVLYPMRMTDLSLLAYNEEPGPLAREVAADPKDVDPLFIDLVEHWPGRERWVKAK